MFRNGSKAVSAIFLRGGYCNCGPLRRLSGGPCPRPCVVKISSSMACGMRPSRITAASTPASTAATQVSTFGIMPPVIVPSAFNASIRPGSRSVSRAPVLVQHSGHVGQQEEARRAQRAGDRPRHRVGVDVVGRAIGAERDRRDDRDEALFGASRCQHRWHRPPPVRRRIPGRRAVRSPAADRRRRAGPSSQHQIGESLPDRPSALAARGAEPADDFLVDRSRQHHFGDLLRSRHR
jgi:hypothetical protein